MMYKPTIMTNTAKTSHIVRMVFAPDISGKKTEIAKPIKVLPIDRKTARIRTRVILRMLIAEDTCALSCTVASVSPAACVQWTVGSFALYASSLTGRDFPHAGQNPLCSVSWLKNSYPQFGHFIANSPSAYRLSSPMGFSQAMFEPLSFY